MSKLSREPFKFNLLNENRAFGYAQEVLVILEGASRNACPEYDDTPS